MTSKFNPAANTQPPTWAVHVDIPGRPLMFVTRNRAVAIAASAAFAVVPINTAFAHTYYSAQTNTTAA